MQDGPKDHAPAKPVSTTFEGCADEEAIAKVVEEISNDNCSNKASGCPELGYLVLLRTFSGVFGGASTLSLGCHHDDTAKCFYHRWKHQTCKDHGPPAPHHINFRAPSHCHQVSGFEKE
eukprot:Skav203527  [mRNA]  locus=scaffold687:329858:330214:+ [translate_table: standard]